jgi:hypothetical protein
MGWTITPGASRRDIISARIRDEESDRQRRHCLAHAVRGNVLWTVWEITRLPGNETDRYIGCDLLGTDGEKNWGYKDLEESMGPCQVNCPLKFLSLVPPSHKRRLARAGAPTSCAHPAEDRRRPETHSRQRFNPTRFSHQRQAAAGHLPRSDLPHPAPLHRAAGRAGDDAAAGRARTAPAGDDKQSALFAA